MNVLKQVNNFNLIFKQIRNEKIDFIERVIVHERNESDDKWLHKR